MVCRHSIADHFLVVVLTAFLATRSSSTKATTKWVRTPMYMSVKMTCTEDDANRQVAEARRQENEEECFEEEACS